MRRYTFFLIIAVLIITAALSACGSLPGDTDAEAQEEIPLPGDAAFSENEPPKPVYGGELRLSMRRPMTLNPLLNADVTVDRVLSLIFEPLFNLNANFTLSSNIAALYEPAEDNLSAVITLEPGRFWSDGARITADDLVFSIDLLKSAPSSAVYKHLTDNFYAAVKLSDLSVRVAFNEAVTGMENCFTFPVIPMHYYQNEESPTTVRNMTPVGSGPFCFASYDEDEILLYAAPGAGRPYFDTARVIISPDNETDIHAFNQGLTDILAVDYGKYNKYASTRPVGLTGVSSGLFDFIGFNFENVYLRDKNLREAIAYTLDADALINGAYLGAAKRADSPVHPDSWLVAPELNGYAYDPSEAAMLSRIAFGDTPPPVFRLIVNEENAERMYIADALVSALEDIGIQTRLAALPFDEYAEHLANGDFDIVIGGYNLSFFPDLSFAFASESEGNIFRYASPELDAMLYTAKTADNDAALYTATADAQRHINGELVVISLAFRDTALLTADYIYGVTAPAPNNIFSNVREWYMIR